MDASAATGAHPAAATYRSFADATRAVLDLLDRHLPEATVFLAHLDRAQGLHRVVDSRGATFGLRANHTMPLEESWCAEMAAGRAPSLCNDLLSHPVYSKLPAQRLLRPGAYLGIPLELGDGSKVGSLAALSIEPDRFTADDQKLFAMLARVLAIELERETSERDVRRLNSSLRSQAQAMGELGRVAAALTGDEDARPLVCAAACAVASAPIAFLLEPAGRAFMSTAVHGVEIGQVTIQPRDDAAGRAFQSPETYFVGDAADHPALARPLVEATSARSALFEPVLRDGQIAGVLIVIWQETVDRVSESVTAMLRLLAAQAGVAIEQAGLRTRMEELALTDPLTGLASRRIWEEELPRELARSRRSGDAVSIAVLDLDHMAEFNAGRGEEEGDRLIKETAAKWAAELREVDLIARLDGTEFGVVLPVCGLGEACEVIDRLRAATPRGRTASAGVARWDHEEPAELLVARCHGALEAAKASGRDITLPAD
jgi:diguanylate cyclase (GGDEF)-like protein